MIIAANLKTNLTRKQTAEYIAELEDYVSNGSTQEVLVFPAMSSLDTFNGKVMENLLPPFNK